MYVLNVQETKEEAECAIKKVNQVFKETGGSQQHHNEDMRDM